MPRFRILMVVAAIAIAACGDGGGGSQSSYCQALRDAQRDALTSTTAPTGPSTSIDYKALNERFDEALERISSKAPSELEDDYKAVEDYFAEYLKLLQNPTDTALRQKLTDMAPQYRTAQEAIAKYNKDECNFSVTTSTPAAGGPGTTGTTRTP